MSVETGSSADGSAATRREGWCRATVVVALYEHAEWIVALLESLFAQWRPDLELLIVDDASTDGSFGKALATLQARSDIPATLLRNERPLHHGIAAQVARYSSGPIIIKADSDDVALPGRLDALLAVFESDAACRMVTSNAVLLSEEGVPTGLYEFDTSDTTIDDAVRWAATASSNLWLGATMAFHRSLLTDFPAVDPVLCPYGLDIVLAFRAVLIGTHRFLARPLVGWRQHQRNTHRSAGAGESDAVSQERYAALIGMALAQRIRDVRHVCAGSTDPSRFGGALARCGETFFTHYDSWCRARTALGGSTAIATVERVGVPVPPIALFEPGTHRFGRLGALGTLAEGWRGFHKAEAEWTWTSAAALMAVRVGAAVRRMTLVIAGQAWQEGAWAYASVNLGERAGVRLPRSGTCRIELDVAARWSGDMVLLLIEAPNARMAQEVDPLSVDHRRLGIMLLTLELDGTDARAARSERAVTTESDRSPGIVAPSPS